MSVRVGGWRIIAALLGVLVVAGCGLQRDERLPGERLDVRALDTAAEAEAAPADDTAAALPALRLAAPVANSEWTHRNGTPAHRIAHPALGTSLAPVWSTEIGTGNGRRRRMTAEPVVAGGRIFTLDAAARVTAVAPSGAVLWARDLAAGTGRSEAVSGGGLAFGEGRLFVTSALRLLAALDPATGAVLWTQEFDAPVTAAPTVADGVVYVISADSSAWAIDVETGRVRWQLPGAPSQSEMVGGAGPAVSGRLIVLPYGSGEVAGALRRAGVRVWGTTVAGQRRGRAWANITDITGDPVIDGGTVYVGNQSGRVVALDLQTGERRWTATEAAYSPVWPAGGAIFLISDEGRLVRLDAATGETQWAVQLPSFIERRGFRLNPFARPTDRRGAVHAHYGPVLAGGRLIVASGDGLVRSFDPATGALVGTLPLPAGAAANPVVAGQTLYVLTGDGRLNAFR